MYLRQTSFVRVTALEPGTVCALPIRGTLAFGLIGTTEDDFGTVSKLFVTLRQADSDVFGGAPLIHVQQMSSASVVYFPDAYFVPEISDKSFAPSPEGVRFLGLKDADTYFCLRHQPFLRTFNTRTGADSNKPIQDMGAAFLWKVEAAGTDGRPVTICEC